MNHQHACACGSVLTCHMERDKCAVPASGQWDCPTCEQEQRDEYFRNYKPLREQLKAAKSSLRTQERHAHHR